MSGVKLVRKKNGLYKWNKDRTKAAEKTEKREEKAAKKAAKGK